MADARIRLRPYGHPTPPPWPGFISSRCDSSEADGTRRNRSSPGLPSPPTTTHARAGDGRITLVAEGEDGEILAYGELKRDGHIDHLYCHPAASGSGLAQRLLEALVDHARSSGVPRLYVEASELARGLFLRNGFMVLRRRDFELRSVAIHNYAMERRFD